jgi:hypothetical protein
MVMITGGDNQGHFLRWTPRVDSMMRAFESECVLRRVRPVVATYHIPTRSFFGANGTRVALGEVVEESGVLGCCAYTLGLDDTGLRLVLAEAERRSLPLSLLEDAGEPVAYQASPRCLLVTLAVGPACAYQVGTYLLGLGHRRIAFVSHLHDKIWSRNREQGLRAAAADAGLTGAIVPVTSEHFDELVLDARRGARIEAEAFERVTAPIREGSSGDAQIGRHVLTTLSLKITDVLGGFANRRVIRPMFEQALRADATAWVCVNDAAALDAVAFLRAAGKRVPHDISVMGFDDSVEAFEARLTSYNFNLRGAVGMMISHVTDPARTASLYGREGTIEVPGFVTPRMTTARV